MAYTWRSQSFATRQELVHHMGDAHAAESVTVGLAEVHIVLAANMTAPTRVLVYALVPETGEVCDVAATRYND
jgi:hypothetical protein